MNSWRGEHDTAASIYICFFPRARPRYYIYVTVVLLKAGGGAHPIKQAMSIQRNGKTQITAEKMVILIYININIHVFNNNTQYQ